MKCIVIGLGMFGKGLVEELFQLGHEVIVADNHESKIESVKEKCSAAFCINATDELSLSVLPLTKVDLAIVAIGEDLGASVRVVSLLKKHNVQNIYARAADTVHRDILHAFGIDKILAPEEEYAHSLVRQLDLGVKTDLFRIDKDYCVFRFKVPLKFIGRCPNELNLSMDYNLKIIAIKKVGKTQNCLGIEYNQCLVAKVTEADIPLAENDELVCYGKESDFQKLCRRVYN